MSRPELAAAVREHYPMPPGAPGAADPTRQPVRARVESPSSATTPAAASDEEITTAVRRQIMSELALDGDDLFIRQGIKVKTVNGRVTLTGQLKNEKEKRQIITAAERVVGAGKVDDEMEPRTR